MIILQKSLLLALLILLQSNAFAQNDIENVFVEIYYISDENDETDTNGGPPLLAGSITYRIFIDLAQGSKLRAIYGDVNHPIKIESTEPIFNNEQRGRTFGHLIQNNFLNRNTVALDSWLSLGAASNLRMGVLKAFDPDGSIIGGVNNDGGSAAIPVGLLVNDDPLMGLPLTIADGLLPASGSSTTPADFTVIPSDAFDAVFRDITNPSGSFVANSVTMRSVSGVVGPTSDNLILIGQITTKGDLSFQLNIEVINAAGNIVKYVGNDENLLPGEIASGLLKYPPQCGCTDPAYLEFNPSAPCDDGSCTTIVVLGCANPEACNFNPSANLNVPSLCCFGPEDCNGLDINIVCPALSSEDGMTRKTISVYPNPTFHNTFINMSGYDPGTYTFRITNVSGQVFDLIELRLQHQEEIRELSLGHLPAGMYVIQIFGNQAVHTSRLMKL